MKKPQSPDDVVVQRLDTLIRLQAAALISGMSTQRERIGFLAKAGLGPTAIAEILGTNAGYVSVELARLRKSSTKVKGETQPESLDGGQ